MNTMLKVLLIILFATTYCVNNLYLPAANLDQETAEEIQNALCSITTKEIEATANATITRQLKGVCTSNELNLKLDKLLTKVLQEIDGIKYILEINGFKVPEPDVFLFNDSLSLGYKDFHQNLSISIAKDATNNKLLRMEEILMYNDTSVDTDEGNKYVYYWKIQNIDELLVRNDMYKSSPDFSVLGHTLHLQFYPNYLDKNHFAVLLKPESHGFLKKHKIIVLNQLNPALDLSSGVLYGIKSSGRMLKLSEHNLKIEGFILANSLVLKLEIFLSS